MPVPRLILDAVETFIVAKLLREQLTSRARRSWAWVYGCYVWLVFGIVILALSFLSILLRKPAYMRPVARFGAWLMFRVAAMPISVSGLQRLPEQPHVLLVNHTSFLDPMVLTALLPARPAYAFCARQQHRSQALLWPLLKALGTVVLGRSDSYHRASNIELLTAGLRRGDNLIVFPEGGITPEAGLHPFHSGAFVAAATENVPVVIAGLNGARAALRLGTWMPHRMPIHLEIGAVLMPSGTDRESLLRLSSAAHEAMMPLVGETDAAEELRE